MEGAVAIELPPNNNEAASSPLIRSTDSRRPFNSLNDARDDCWLLVGSPPFPGGGRGRLLWPKGAIFFVNGRGGALYFKWVLIYITIPIVFVPRPCKAMAMVLYHNHIV